MTSLDPSVRSILAAIDESERAPYVFATAAMLATTLNARLFLIRVVTVPLDVPPAAHMVPDGLEKKLQQDAEEQLNVLMESAPDVVFGAHSVLRGEPWRRILETSHELDVDLIVMGSHRYRGLSRVLGTVAAKVVNNSDRNVMVVHERAS